MVSMDFSLKSVGISLKWIFISSVRISLREIIIWNA
jgi:hypothetical protein